ncbi:MAG TPA: sulfite exporter TauE/SafE family protein [Actinomycetota bacterium]|nr:sulfite exporter TauE/SafE family protein [Actinomycetota bacterium]
MASRGAPAAIAIGFAAGVASGLLGVGGGVILVPGLVAALGASQHQAHATSLAAIVPIGLVGFAVFALDGRVNYAIAGLLVLGALVGAPVGARAMSRVPERPLAIAFAIVLVVAGVRLIV